MLFKYEQNYQLYNVLQMEEPTTKEFGGHKLAFQDMCLKDKKGTLMGGCLGEWYLHSKLVIFLRSPNAK